MAVISTVDELVTRASRLVDLARTESGSAQRRLLGIVGAPGAGKSTLASRIAEALVADAVVVPMDGFHLAQRELERLGRVERKGAPDTFDAHGFVNLVGRLRANTDDVVYAPIFERAIEEPIAGAIAVEREVPLVIVEGNYLLLQSEPWLQLGALLDETWYVQVDEAKRVDRLVARHRRFGRSSDAARRHAAGSDQHNADLVAATAGHATVVVELAP